MVNDIVLDHSGSRNGKVCSELSAVLAAVARAVLVWVVGSWVTFLDEMKASPVNLPALELEHVCGEAVRAQGTAKLLSVARPCMFRGNFVVARSNGKQQTRGEEKAHLRGHSRNPSGLGDGQVVVVVLTKESAGSRLQSWLSVKFVSEAAAAPAAWMQVASAMAASAKAVLCSIAVP